MKTTGMIIDRKLETRKNVKQTRNTSRLNSQHPQKFVPGSTCFFTMGKQKTKSSYAQLKVTVADN
ncbi:CLUMA_CG009244, isoform A [Clunio marinus]|uniref:CLUMA_CG009244, isoform A n=1 Tax=Clunio marinus TaxID=568069 RepID=A0A1J1I6G3_9DIPT|nr:CLUMA_CG009244, isoform A [Clunio marinus]